MYQNIPLSALRVVPSLSVGADQPVILISVYSVYSVMYYMFAVQCRVYLQCYVLHVWCTVYSVQCPVYSVMYYMFAVQCRVYLQCTQNVFDYIELDYPTVSVAVNQSDNASLKPFLYYTAYFYIVI